MPRSLGNVIADSLQLSLSYAERLLKDIPADQFARMAAPGGVQVESNHPAFVFGHLSLYGGRILEQLGLNAAAVAPTAKFVELFSKDARCRDDVSNTIYPPMSEITERFFAAYKAALTVLRETPDEAFQTPNPAPAPMSERFPTIGSMHNFYVGGHLMMHLGQISTWRRMQALPPA